MFGREKRFGRETPTDAEYADRGSVATAERAPVGNGNGDGGAVVTRDPGMRTGTAATSAVALDEDARLRQRERFGGFNWGAAFFGWLVAIGMGVILTAIVAAAGAAIGLTQGTSTADATNNAGTIGIVGGALLIGIAMLAYYCGGYVAGRMSRFDGARQGLGVWAFGLVVTLLVAAAGAIFGDQYNVFQNLNLPRIPLNPSELTTGGIITLAGIALGSLIAAMIGGKLGQRYHRRVDRAALVD
jgi:hypothetical protein